MQQSGFRRTGGARSRRRWVVAALLAIAASSPEAWSEDAFFRDNTRTASSSDRPSSEPRPAKTPKAKPEAEKTPQVEEWPPSEVRALSLQSEKLSEAIFNLIEDVEIVKLGFGDGGLSARAGRRIFDNHNVLGSWTVIDHLRIDLSYPFYSVTWPVVGNLTGGFSVGGSIGNDFTDIRQVMPKDFARLPPIHDPAVASEAMKDSQPVESDLPAPALPSDEDVADKTPVYGPEPEPERSRETTKASWFHPFEGLSKARYGRLWNILGFPIRIPTEAEWISHMEDGEIISFTASGTIDAGPSIGWSLDVTQLTSAIRADASLGVYVTGRFRVSILRENERFVRVRITRLAEAGGNANAGGSTGDVIEGFTVANAAIGRNKTAVTPFSFTFSNGKGRALDLAYRYDLAQAAGRMAYEQAVSGRYGTSDQLAGGFDWQRAPEDSAVRKIGTRSTTYTTDSKSSGARYGFIYRHNHDARVTNSDIIATFQEGTTRVFRSDIVDSQSWRFIWGTFERLNYSFRFNVDLDRFELGQGDAITLVAQGEITDTDTTGAQMHAYMDEVESAAQRPGFFPRPPKYYPDPDFPHYDPDLGFDRRRDDADQQHSGRTIDYYRASFFYQLTFSQAQIEKFLDTPYERVWPALEKAFDVGEGTWGNAAKRFAYALAHAPERALNIPLYAVNIHFREGSMLEHARAIRTAWMHAKAQKTVVDRIGELGRMFADRRYGPELVRLLRAVLEGEKVSYVIQGSSHTFGYLRDEGIGTTAIDPLPERKERRIDFDAEGARPQADPDAAVRKLSCTVLGSDRYRVTLTLDPDAKPQALYVSLVEVRPWKLPRTVAQQAYLNKDKAITGGDNTLLVTKDTGFLAELLSKIEPGNEYFLKVAYTRDGVSWGPITETHFSVPLAPITAP